MRFKRQRRSSQLPVVNLVPMLDVLMVVLTFFIIVSMTLTTQQGVEVPLPNNDSPSPAEAEPKVAIVTADPQGQLLFNNQPIQATELPAQVKAYLEKTPQGFVVLQAAEQLPYEQVVTLLGQMKEAGGERVSLAIE